MVQLMRCAILRLMSVGDPAVGPRAMRDDAPKSLGPPLLPQASKTSGQKVAPRSATREAVSWKARFRVSTSWKTSATEGEAEER